MDAPGSSHSRLIAPQACTACGERLPEHAQFCPGCGRPVKPLKGSSESRTGPRTDQPLVAPPPLDVTTTQSDISELIDYLPERYKVLKKVGQGGMGTVYRCLDQALERQVAIKIMTERYRSDPQSERRFMREARAQATVNHPNVATVLNFGVSTNGRPYLVMEYLEGEDLRSLIRQDKIIEPIKACDLMRQVADGMEDAHVAGVVHRDLKPSNVMIVKDHKGLPWVKILDLGLAKIIGGQTDLKSITLDTASLLVGTPAYMSPEQVAGAAVDGRADIYAMGVVFFEMLTGRLPFESETMEGWLYQHLHVKPPAPSTLNPALAQYPQLDQVVLWMMSKQPHERPKTSAELSSLLKRLVDAKLLMDKTVRSARISGPRTALRFEEQPHARKSGPLTSIATDDVFASRIGPAQAGPSESSAARAAATITEQRRNNYLTFCKAAEKAESERKWDEALEQWQNALPLADRAATAEARIEGCRREMEFESQLGAANSAAKAGEWEKAETCLNRLAAGRPADARIEQMRARLPKYLVSAWLILADAKIRALPEGDVRHNLTEQLGIVHAQTGSMATAFTVIENATTKPESRAVGLAQALAAASHSSQNEGLRPYFDKVSTMAGGLVDPSERGRAQLEVGRALSAYGDQSGASAIFQSALSAFNEAKSKGIPLQVMPKKGKTGSVRRQAIDRNTISMTATSLSGPKTLRTSWENAIASVAQAQADAGLVEDSLASATFIEDPWILAQTLSQISQICAKIGRTVEAERVAGQITFALPKTQAYRALAVSRVYCGNITGAEDMIKNITGPAERIPLLGLLAAGYALRKELGRAEVRVAEAIKCSGDVIGAHARFVALLSAAEPILTAGYHDSAEPLTTSASKLIDLMDDPAERLRATLQLAKLLETSRISRVAATRTIMFSPHSSPQFMEPLRQALVIWRQVRHSADRLESTERLAFAIAWGSSPELASELLTACRDAAECALTYIGLSTGMA